LVIMRTEVAQLDVRFRLEALGERREDARFADAGFARDQHDLAVASLDARPAAQQEVDFLVAANEPAQRCPAQRLEPARQDARTGPVPARQRPGDTLPVEGAEIAVFEEIAEKPARPRRDDDGVRLGERLQPGSKVRRCADYRLLLRRAFADQLS